jgi:hypothetical protein
METRPVILSHQVCLSYLPDEAAGLVNAAMQLSPYEMREFAHYIRIDSYSLIDRGWRCAFILSKASARQPDWLLDTVEYLPSLSLNHALASLGHLETFGLNRLKYGL